MTSSVERRTKLGAPKAKGKLSKYGKKYLSAEGPVKVKDTRGQKDSCSPHRKYYWTLGERTYHVGKGRSREKNRLTPQRKEGRVKKGRDAPRGASRELVHSNSRENITVSKNLSCLLVDFQVWKLRPLNVFLAFCGLLTTGAQTSKNLPFISATFNSWSSDLERFHMFIKW